MIRPPSGRAARGGDRDGATSAERAVWFVAGVAVLVGAVASALGPMGADETCFAYAAWRLLQGDRPGIELWEMKPPLHVYYYGAFFRAFGANETALLVGDSLAQLVGMAVFAWGAARRGALRLGLSAALAYGLLYFFVIPQSNHGQVEALSNALTLTGCGILLGLREVPLAWMLAGFLFGTTAWTKIVPPAFGVLFALTQLQAEPRDARARRALAWLVTGVALGIAAWPLLWAVQGDAVQIVRDIAAARSFQGGTEGSPSAAGLMGLVVAYSAGWGIVTLALASGVAWRRAAGMRLGGVAVPIWSVLVAGWTLIALGIVVVQGKYYGYHFIPFLLPMALSTALCHAARGAATGEAAARPRNAIAAVVVAGLLASAVAPALEIGCGLNTARNLVHLGRAVGAGTLEPYRDRVAAQETWAPDRSARVEVGRVVAGLTAPDERVLYLDTGATAFWARRPSYLRYFAPLPVQRVRFDPRLAGSPISRDAAARIGTFAGNVVVWDPGWIPAAVSPAVDDLLARFVVARTIGPYEVRVRQRRLPDDRDASLPTPRDARRSDFALH